MTQRSYAIFLFVIVASLLSVAIFVVPFTANAQNSPPQFIGDLGPSGLVPCGDPGEPPCGLCHLVDLASDSLRFAVYFTIFVATLLFVYAGFLYITAGGDSGKISQATGIFGKVVVGMIIVLTSWLIVDTVLKVFLKQSPVPWNQIECTTSTGTFGSPSGRSSSIGGGGGGQQGGGGVVVAPTRTTATFPDGYTFDTRTLADKTGEEFLLRNTLAGLCASGDFCEIRVNRSNCAPNTPTSSESRCTDLTGLKDEVVDVVNTAAHECGERARAQFGTNASCGVIISGGNELGDHNDDDGCSSTSNTHCSGNKVDISTLSGELNDYVNDDTYFITENCSSGGRKGRVSRTDGSCWVDEGSHWDVTREGL